MSSKSTNPMIVNKGNPISPRYIYSSLSGEIPMGIHEMYRTFMLNFSDNNVANLFFNSKDGIKMLTLLLSNEKCTLYLVSEESKPSYIEIIRDSFNIIKLYFSSITNSGKTKDVYISYTSLIPAIKKKAENISLKLTIVSTILLEICDLLTTHGRVEVRDVSQSLILQGSIEAAKNKLVNFSVIGKKNNDVLSPIDSSVFDIIREYCIKNIGEGSKVSENSFNNSTVVKDNLLKAMGYFINNIKMIEKYSDNKIKEVKPNLNSNSMENVNRILICFIQNPELMHIFLKITEKMLENYTEDEINKLKEIFSTGTLFKFEPTETFNYNSDYYIGGTKEKNSFIVRITTSKDFISDTFKDHKKNKDIEITKITSTTTNFKIELKLIKFIMKILTEAKDKDVFSSIEKTNNAKKIYDSIIDGTFGEIKSEIIPDWWQKLFIDYIKAGKSFILVGDTSGGKTFISMMGIRILFNSYLNDPTAKFIYLAPTSQLAILQFANILTAYPNYSQYFGICCKSIVNIPATARILIGTPNEIKKYVCQIQFHRDTIITLDNINEQIINAVNNPFKNSCKILFIDEIQTLSPTYVQSQEIEQIMECKAIEEIMETVSYLKDTQSQVVGMSATLSPQSIINIKRKICEITKIPEMFDIIYTHEDIGLKDISKKDEYIPIMKRPILIPIKVVAQNIESFERKEEITQQTLNNENVEMIVRDAISRKVLPLSIYREDELTTIQMYKDFISYLERKNDNCRIWQNLYTRYHNEMDSLGGNLDKIKSLDKINQWRILIKENIQKIINNNSIDTVVHKGDFDTLISSYIHISGDNIADSNPIYSPELYGLLVEYISITTGNDAFTKDIHPYYRFGVVRGDDFFNLTVPGTNTDSVLKKILIAQDADPSSNTGSIIPLIMRGIRFGVGLITSSIPLGFQLEIFKFITIKSKQNGGSAPIPILFCEYGMSMGVNFSLMSVAILRNINSTIGPSELKQIIGRAGRRGNSSGANPVVYGFNISNFYTGTELEILDFDVSNISSNFFTPNEIYDFLCRLIVKYENNKEEISKKNINICETIMSGDSFKNLGGTNILLVRKIQIAKYQIRELFDKCKNIFPQITEEIFKLLYSYLQKAEFQALNTQIS